MGSGVGEQGRRYWVVSPNVNNNKKTVSAWARASVLAHGAFMGWEPNHKHIGHKFAHEIAPKHVILIARSHNRSPQIVGFGVVQGGYKMRIQGVEIPEGGAFGSARKLRPFVNLTTERLPGRIPFIKALNHSSALAELHPVRNRDHRRVCEWLDRRLSSKGKRRSEKNPPGTDGRLQQGALDTQIAAPPRNYQLDFKRHTKDQDTTATRTEARLLGRYRQWLKWQCRELLTLKWKKLQCDGFEEGPKNLIEAKGATSREHLRMAVGELLDYAYLTKKKFGRLNKAILVPKKPSNDLEEWLRNLNISLIWPEKGAFRDNAKDQFT